jgi:hypothetical protein
MHANSSHLRWLGPAYLCLGVILLIAPKGAANTLVATTLATPQAYCTGWESTVLFCNFETYCSCTPSSTFQVHDSSNCTNPCEVSGGLSCGGILAENITEIPCGDRAEPALTCPNGPGFGCDWNVGQLLLCKDC